MLHNFYCELKKDCLSESVETFGFVVVVVLLFYLHDKHLRSCRDSQIT